MMPMYHQQQQQQQQLNLPNGFQYGFQQPQQNGFGLQPSAYGPNGIPINWQQYNWLGGFVNGQQMPLLPPPPFYYPIDISQWTGVRSNRKKKNQVQSNDKLSPSENPSTPRRGILKNTTGESNTPTPRRLVDFMPEGWQQPAFINNMTVPENRRPSVTTPVQMNSKVFGSAQDRTRSKKTPEKAHLDTLRRRQRRQRSRATLLENSEELGLLNDNRFILLSETDEEENENNENSEADDNNKAQAMKNNKKPKPLSKKAKKNANRQARTTTEVPINSEHVVGNNKKPKARGNNQRQIYSEIEQDSLTLHENEQSNEESNTSIKDKRKIKTYLEGFKILNYLKNRMNTDRKIALDIKDSFNEVCAYAKNTILAYDNWVHNQYEAQVWKNYHELGTTKNHWAKEVVNITHTREAKTNTELCEKKLSHCTSLCFDASTIITGNMKELSSNPNFKTATVVASRSHDLMLDYIKEATEGLQKMSINRIHRASMEKDEWDALQAFEKVASEQQKTYAKTYCKAAFKLYQKKKKNLDLVAAHISIRYNTENLTPV